MRIKNVSINNYRMLHKVDLALEDDTTLIIGKNNSGKTSFFEIMKMMLAQEVPLSFEDFSQNCYAKYKSGYTIYEEYIAETDDEKKEELLTKLQEEVPSIDIRLEIHYDKDKDSLIELSEFITDVDPAQTNACIYVSYECINSINLYKAFRNRKDINETLLLFLKSNITSHYRTNCYAFDIATGMKRPIDGTFKYKIQKVVSFEEIKALRILDDKKGDKHNTLALGFAKYYKERDKTTEDVEKLEAKLKEMGADLKEKYREILKSILLDLKTFGAETPVTIPEITIDSVFDSEAVIRNNIRYLYKQDEIDLPESYNGLGYSNLIYMILEMASFIEKHRNSKEEKISEFLVIMIEEPEAHMHPQMQQVFIKQIANLLLSAKRDGITVQLIITSHSSHIISEAGIDLNKGFNRLRYFTKSCDSVVVKDFNKLQIGNDKNTFRFLKQYLNIHKSDLFFADKVIMVEGVTERLLMPQMIAKVAPSLLSEYITVLEVGGVYTHKFQEILEFIEVKTLLITDLDSVHHEIEKASPVNIGDKLQVTSNATIINWLPKKTLIFEILAATEEEKIFGMNIRVAFQICEPKATYYPRSFEEAFIERNRDLIFGKKSVKEDGKEIEKNIKNEFSLFRSKKIEDLVDKLSYDLAPSDKGKTNFAFDVMSFDEETYGNWFVPFYIREGLEWLAGMCVLNFIVSPE